MSDTTVTPPWGSDAEFDPQKAWNLIQNLRAENGEAKAKAEAAATERDQFASQATEYKSQFEQAAEARAAIEKDLDGERFGRQFDNLAHTKGVPLELASTLKVSDLEDAEAKLSAWASRLGDTAKAAPKPDPAQVAEPVVDEKEALARQFFGIDS